ncbi:MAG: formate dehydrogenase subunit alpha [Pseudomonadota bacterium]|nr:formate dehydrogenase subunit alpha [Pseudomonadota bacterium]
MTDQIEFILDGKTVTAEAGETIWQVAEREGVEIPHLCYSTQATYRPDGNCRVCMVEIEGERTLAASCLRAPTSGMEIKTATTRVETARKMVMELLLADQPAKESAHDPQSELWHWAEQMGQLESRFPAREAPAADNSHPAMAVNLDACIQCNLCVRACREAQVNDVIGMAYRGHGAKVVFDFDDPMASSTCVGCGECVQACPTGALMPANLLDMAGVRDGYADEQIKSVCPYCGVGCQITYNVKDNKILWVDGREGPGNSGRLCVKGRFGFDYVNHPHRLTTPLIRRADAAKDAGADIDPANPLGQFREATWDEALDVAAAGLAKIRQAEGPKGLAGFGSAKGSNEEAYLFQKLVRVGFGTNNVDHCTRLCHASSVAALLETIGSGAVTAPFTDALKADLIVVIGANPTENHPVAATFFKNAAKSGATLVVCDPRGHALKKHATHMVQFTPGSDVAMLNAMMNVIVEEELYDRQYIEAHTEGFEELKEHVKKFPPEAMAEICGVDAETLRTVARKYARAERAIIFWGMGISQHVHGTDNARCLIALALMTGQIGRPGTGLHPLRGQNNVQGASDVGLIPIMYPDYQRVEDAAVKARFEDFWGVELDPDKGLTVVEIMDAVHDDVIKGMYIMGENPAMSDPNTGHARHALAKLEHLVVQDIFLTETAFHADVVLPASAWPEKDGTVTNSNRQVQMGHTALDMPSGVRQDWWIIQEIARRIDLDWDYDHPRDVYGEMRGCMPSLDNIGWDRLMAESAVTYPSDADDQPGHDVLFGDGFPTATSRGKMVPADIIPPDEQPDHDFPMILSTGRVLEHWHTGAITRRATVLDALEPEAIACLSPTDLDRLGIAPGDKVRVATRRGVIETTARRDGKVPPGVVFVPFCFADAAANMLTNPALDPIGKIPEYKYCAARVEKGVADEV